MIDWINEGGKHWGWQMRLTYMGKDGWPPRTILDKMMKEGVLGASAGRFMQFFPECLDAEALEFNNWVKSIPDEDIRNRAFIHWCVIGKGKVKAARMNESKTVYYDRMEDVCKAVAKAAHRVGRIQAQKKIKECGLNSQNSSQPSLAVAA